MNFLSVGECMVEMSPTDQADHFKMAFAGDTLNTAWYLKRARPSWNIDYLTGIGSDTASQNMVTFLDNAGLGTGALVEVPDRTVGLYMIELNDGERSFSYWRSQSAARLLAQDQTTLEDRFKSRDVIYFSGITLAILEGDGRKNLFAALDTARRAGAHIVFDPNLRPKLWSDTTTMCDAVMAAARLSDVVLPSHDDEVTFFGDADPQATVERYKDAGGGTVIGKNGGGEIRYWFKGSAGVVKPEVIDKVVDSTAAGDSFNAGFLAEFPNGDVEAAIRAGCTMAGKVIQGRGALVAVT